MSRTMYDAVNPANIPADATMVAGYDDGPESQWPADAWTKWPAAIMVHICVTGNPELGVVGDCETGDLTPDGLVDWVLARRMRGVDPTGYCSAGNLWTCRHAFDVRRVPQPHWWVADPDRALELGGGIVALQQDYPGPYDVSTVADQWPGVDTAPAPVPMPSPPTTGPDYPEETLTPHELTLPVPLDPNGDGHYSASQVGVDDVNNIVSVVFIVGPPAAEGHYDRLPTGWAIDQNEELVIEGGTPGGQYGVRIWTA